MTINKKGFTLIELLVVVLIIGILASFALPQYFKSVERSRVAEAMSTFAAIKASEESTYAKNGTYTGTWDTLDISVKNSAGVICSGAAACSTKVFRYTLVPGGPSITALRLTTPVAMPTRYGATGYTLTFNINTGVVTCSNVNCSNELI